MGFHAYLQAHSIPFESAIAKGLNMQMFKHIKEQAVAATRKLAKERGECPDGTGYGVRNAHLLSIAPNASSSIICGNTSPSIEPFRANAYTQKTKSGSALMKNKYLEEALERHGQNNSEVWKSVITQGGSAQHLDFLTDWERDVFKTALEIDQRWVIDFAADRQQYVCQSQSVNLFFPALVSKQELHNIHMLAWKKGLKSLYYVRSEAIKRADVVSEQKPREKLIDYDKENTCLSCEG
jgi:ribonucleoside-diphosphate reductase alpha chain